MPRRPATKSGNATARELNSEPCRTVASPGSRVRFGHEGWGWRRLERDRKLFLREIRHPDAGRREIYSELIDQRLDVARIVGRDKRNRVARQHRPGQLFQQAADRAHEALRNMKQRAAMSAG